MSPRSTSNERMLNITVRDPISSCFLSERAFLHGVAASLLLAHNSLLWYFPNVLRANGLLDSFDSNQEWSQLIADYTLLSHLGLAYIIFSYLDAAMSRSSAGGECRLQNIAIVAILEGAFAVSWGYSLYQNFGLMMEFACLDGTWQSLCPTFVESLIFVTWAGALLHTLVPAIEEALRARRWSESVEVFGMDVQNYPWSLHSLEGGIVLADESLLDETPTDRKEGIHLV